MTVREKSHRLFITLNILVPLFIGTAIYVWLRPDATLTRLILDLAGISSMMPTIGSALPAITPDQSPLLVAALHALATSLPTDLIRTLRNFGSDLLWAYALTATLMWILGTCRRSAIAAAAIAATLGCLLEAAQLANLFSGTFDPLDILLETAAAFVAAGIIHLHHHGGKYETHHQSPKHHPGPRLVHGHGRRIVIQGQRDQSDLDRR